MNYLDEEEEEVCGKVTSVMRNSLIVRISTKGQNECWSVIQKYWLLPRVLKIVYLAKGH